MLAHRPATVLYVLTGVDGNVIEIGFPSPHTLEPSKNILTNRVHDRNIDVPDILDVFGKLIVDNI